MYDKPISEIASMTLKTFADKTEWHLKSILVGAVGLILSPIGGLETLRSTLVIFVITMYMIDLVTGLTRSLIKRRDAVICVNCKKGCHGLSSELMFRGVVKLMIYLILLYMGLSLTKIQDLSFAVFAVSFVGNAIIVSIILTESISVIENLSCISTLAGIDIPVLDSISTLLHRQAKKMEEQVDEATEELETNTTTNSVVDGNATVTNVKSLKSSSKTTSKEVRERTQNERVGDIKNTNDTDTDKGRQ